MLSLKCTVIFATGAVEPVSFAGKIKPTESLQRARVAKHIAVNHVTKRNLNPILRYGDVFSEYLFRRNQNVLLAPVNQGHHVVGWIGRSFKTLDCAAGRPDLAN